MAKSQQYDAYGNPIDDGADSYGTGGLDEQAQQNRMNRPVTTTASTPPVVDPSGNPTPTLAAGSVGPDGNPLPTPSTPQLDAYGNPLDTTGGNPAPPVLDTSATDPSGARTPGSTTPTGLGPSTGRSGAALTIPSYVNASDPVQSAVWAAFQKKGITPRDQSDFQYWVDKINNTGGGWGNQDNQNYWLSRMAQASGGVGDYSGAPEAESSSTTGQPDTSALDAFIKQLFAGNDQSQFSGDIHNDILTGIKDASAPVDPNSPEVAGPNAAFDASAQAARRQGQEASAERGYAEGSPTGALDASTSAGYEGLGRAEAAHDSGTIANIYQQNRTKLQNLLQMGAGVLSGDEQRQITSEIAALDAELSKLGITTQNQQFYDSLAASLGSGASATDTALLKLLTG